MAGGSIASFFVVNGFGQSEQLTTVMSCVLSAPVHGGRLNNRIAGGMTHVARFIHLVQKRANFLGLGGVDNGAGFIHQADVANALFVPDFLDDILGAAPVIMEHLVLCRPDYRIT